MYPRLTKLTLLLPYQPPQEVIERELTRGVFRLLLVDRWDRKINYIGSDIGFGVRLYKSTVNNSYIVVKGQWDEALYASERGRAVRIEVLDIATDDQ